jgi:hypothetical protein
MPAAASIKVKAATSRRDEQQAGRRHEPECRTKIGTSAAAKVAGKV